MQELTQMREKLINNLAQKNTQLTDLTEIKTICETNKILISKINEDLKNKPDICELAMTNTKIKEMLDELTQHKEHIDTLASQYYGIKLTFDKDYDEIFKHELLKTEVQNLIRNLPSRESIVKSFKDVYECLEKIENTGLTPRHQKDDRIEALEKEISFLKSELDDIKEKIKNQPKITVIDQVPIDNDENTFFQKPKKFIKH